MEFLIGTGVSIHASPQRRGEPSPAFNASIRIAFQSTRIAFQSTPHLSGDDFGTLIWALPSFWCKQDILLFILMNTVSLFANPNLLQLEHISSEPNRTTLIVKTKSRQALCPRCHSPSAHLHSRYVRRLADLPWLGIAVRCHTTILIAIPGVCLALLHVLVPI